MVGTRSVSAALVVLVVTVVGCGGEGSEPEAAPAPSEVAESTKPTGEPSTASGDAPKVGVLDQGSRPRRLLELDVEEGHIESSTLTMTATQRGQGGTVHVPPMSFVLTSTVESVDGDEIEVSQAYDDVRVEGREYDPELVRQQRAEIEPLAGVTGTVWLTRGGAAVRTQFDIPAAAPTTTRSIIQEFGNRASAVNVPYPDQPVGPGARWMSTSETESSGVAVEQVATYTLKSFHGNAFRVAVEIDHHVLPGSTAAGLEVISAEGTRTGMIRGSTKTLAPRRSTVRGATEWVVRADGHRVRSVAEQTIDITTTVR